MVYAIISDVHANEIALSAVLKDARQCGAGRIVCLGDVVGYGPEPEKTASAVRTLCTATIAGNHDDAVSGRLDASDFIDLAADAVLRHREALSDENMSWLKGLPYTYRGRSFICAHGDFTSPQTFEYVTDESEAARNFAATGEQLMFVGHSHVPGIFLTGASGRVYSLPPTDFTLEDGKRYIVNPGSVGYPRTDGRICESTYVLYDDVERTVSFRRIPFTVRSVMQTGRNPRRIGKRTIAAIAAAAAAAAGAAAWLLAPEERVETVTEVLTNNVTKVVERQVTNVVAIASVDRTERMDVPQGAKRVGMVARLSRGSPPAQLQLAFTDAGGRTLWEERWTVKKSKTASLKVPEGTTSATLSGGRTDGSEPATFDTFSLSLAP